jgi:hypothetical protein
LMIDTQNPPWGTLSCAPRRQAARGVALVWKKDDLKFEVKSVLFNHGPNTLTFQLATGDEQFYVIGMFIPPNCTRGVEDLRRAVEACLTGCKLLVMGDLNINVRFPQDKREEVIVDLLDKVNLVNTSRGFQLRSPRRTATRAQWTWSQKRATTLYYMQLDYILARAKERFFFKGAGFRFLRFLQLDHRTIVAVVRAGWEGRPRQYRHKHQKFLLSLLPEPKDADTMAFNALVAKCVKPKPKRMPKKDWISEGTWRLIAKWVSLLWSSCIWQDAAQRMKSKISTAIKVDKRRFTANIGNLIVAELAKGAVNSLSAKSVLAGEKLVATYSIST